ncbi:MAG: hypothetical protein EOM68_09885 [Spirochaetia bacterium]|nr:hypothetical protein [Spirochaetia bacterium]
MIKTKHIFQLSRIIDKMKLSEDIKDIVAETKKKNVDESSLGYKIITALGSKLHMAEAEVMTLLADISGKSKKDIEDQSPKETFGMIRELLSEEGVLDFLLNQQADLKSD